MAGKIDSETVKELREENKKLKKNEVELRGKLEKLQKANVPKAKVPKKSEIDALQLQLQQANNKLDITLSLYEVAQQKILKYTQRKKAKEAEPTLYYEWDLFFNALNGKLTTMKKNQVIPEELPHVRMIAYIVQNLIIMSRSEIIYTFGKIRTMPEEIIQERDSLKEMAKNMEITKLSLEQENADLTTQNCTLNQKVINLERENTKLRDEVTQTVQVSGEIETDLGKIKDLKKHLKEKLKLEEEFKKRIKTV